MRTTIRKLLVLATPLWLSLGDPAAAATILSQYHLSLYRDYIDTDTRELLGDGYVRYDQSEYDALVAEWMEQREQCFENPDECDIDTESLDIELPVVAASFEMLGHQFRDDDISWTSTIDSELTELRIFIQMQDPGTPPGQLIPPYLRFGADNEDSLLTYDVNGVFQECVSGACEDVLIGGEFVSVFDHLEWVLEPVTVAEPGSLAFLGLGILGMVCLRKPRQRRAACGV
jgi:hypothetical protein